MHLHIDFKKSLIRDSYWETSFSVFLNISRNRKRCILFSTYNNAESNEYNCQNKQRFTKFKRKISCIFILMITIHRNPNTMFNHYIKFSIWIQILNNRQWKLMSLTIERWERLLFSEIIFGKSFLEF